MGGLPPPFPPTAGAVFHRQQSLKSHKPALYNSDLSGSEAAVKPDSPTANREAEHLCRKTNMRADETDVLVTRQPPPVSGGGGQYPQSLPSKPVFADGRTDFSKNMRRRRGDVDGGRESPTRTQTPGCPPPLPTSMTAVPFLPNGNPVFTHHINTSPGLVPTLIRVTEHTHMLVSAPPPW